MFVHTVYFWLKKGTTQEQRAEFWRGVETLKNVAAADAVYLGEPAATYRPVVDRTYDVALIVLLKDLEAHDAYQVDPVHKAFVENYAKFWDKVVIYDSE